ncbi:MAG: hypothetical protein JRN06_05785 [Nitrososphaerota archaeon]|nr:hypothetical protein [Nitrososphaerota archaeon]MDG7024126.1 hypothetical protein [Nitrososphaerota archaeon]
MANLMILVWRSREATGDPDVEVKIPASMAKWVPKLMKLVPKKTKEETWGGQEVDFDAMFADLEKMVQEAIQTGQVELMSVKTRDGFVRITVEK